MIKKISALVLALVICLSVVVVPVSAAEVELGDATLGFALEWDKESYKAGDIAYLSIYMDVADDVPIGAGTIAIGLDSAVFNQTDNTKAVLNGNVTYADELLFSFYKSPMENSQFSWLSATLTNKVIAANSADENNEFDHYLKFTLTRNTSGDHENAANQKDGLYGSEIDSTQPMVTIGLVVSADVEPGTKVRAAITSGSLGLNGATAIKLYDDVGNSNSTETIAATATSISKADTTETTGDVVIASIISPLSTQIRFNGPENGDTKAPFDVRTRATVSKADFAALLNTTVENVETVAKDKDDALRVGFVYMADSADGDYDEAAAKAAAIAGEDAPGYKVVNVSYIQRSGDNYVWTCFIAGPDYTDGVNALAYIICDGCEPQFKTVDATTFSELYDAAKAAGIIPKA